MRFSVHIPTAAEGLAHPIPFVAALDFQRLAQHAENLGFSGVWGNYHVATQDYVRTKYAQPPSYYDSLIVLANLAATTHRIELGTAVLVPGMQHIPVLAKQVATLDQLSKGRFRLGMGVGAYREEFEAVLPGHRGAHRGQWLDESLEALRQLFTERATSYAGRWVSFGTIESYPKPFQDPLPIYIGGHNLRAIERAAQWGEGWLPGWQPHSELQRRVSYLRERLAAVGREPSAVEVAPQLSVTIADTDRIAEQEYWSSGIVEHRRSLAYTGRDLSQQVDANLIGSPETIRDKVRLLEDVGVDHCCALWFSTRSIDEMMDQMHHFAVEIIQPLGARGRGQRTTMPSLEGGDRVSDRG